MPANFTNQNNIDFNLQATYKGSVFTRADVQEWIKKQWATMVRRELDQNLLMRQFTMNVAFPQGKVGDTITIPTLGRLGVNDKRPGEPVNLQSASTNYWRILIDKYKEASFMVEDITSIMLDPSGLLSSNLAKEASYAIARDLDAHLLGLRACIQAYSGQIVYSHTTGNMGAANNSRPFTLDAFLKAKLILDKKDVPADKRVLIVSPTQFAQLLALDKVQSMFYRTSAPLESGVVGTLMGVPVYMTSMIGANAANGFTNGGTTVHTPGVKLAADTVADGTGVRLYFPTQYGGPTVPASLPTRWSTDGTGVAANAQEEVHTAIMMHQEAFGLAMLQEPKTEMSRETLYLSDAMVTSTLFGCKDYRYTNAVLIHTNGTIPEV
jgi:hypothetical protein